MYSTQKKHLLVESAATQNRNTGRVTPREQNTGRVTPRGWDIPAPIHLNTSLQCYMLIHTNSSVTNIEAFELIMVDISEERIRNEAQQWEEYVGWDGAQLPLARFVVDSLVAFVWFVHRLRLGAFVRIPCSNVSSTSIESRSIRSQLSFKHFLKLRK